MRSWNDFYNAVDTEELDRPRVANPDEPEEEWRYVTPKTCGIWTLVKQFDDKSVFLQCYHGSDTWSWMMNHWWEENSSNSINQGATGKILMAGLGVGYESFIQDSNPKVKSVTVVEKDSDIITLSSPVLRDTSVVIINDNILHYLENTTNTFDVIYFDIFPDSPAMFPEEVRILTDEAMFCLNDGGSIMFWNKYRPLEL